MSLFPFLLRPARIAQQFVEIIAELEVANGTLGSLKAAKFMRRRMATRANESLVCYIVRAIGIGTIKRLAGPGSRASENVNWEGDAHTHNALRCRRPPPMSEREINGTFHLIASSLSKRPAE